MNAQLPIIWTPSLSLPDRLRSAGVMYAWLYRLLFEAAAKIEELEQQR